MVNRAHRQEVCVLCHSRWPNDRLIGACRCYKKSDSNRLHRECLTSLYANKESDEPPRCPVCYDVYRVSVRYRFLFVWDRMLACRSVSHFLELIIVAVMLLCGCVTLWIFHRQTSSPHFQHPHTGPSNHATDWPTLFIYSLFFLTLIMVPFTMRKVFERWKRANSDVEIDIV